MHMTDIELVKACADAMGIEVHPYSNNKIEHHWRIHNANGSASYYCPLTDDAQAFALIEKLWMYLNPPLRDRRARNKLWYANVPAVDDYHVQNSDLKRAIVESVALMQKAKSGASA